MSDSVLDILMITFNRPSYTTLAVGRLLETCEPGMRVWVWHNGNDSETRRVIESFRGHPNLHRVVICGENKKLREPTNWFWQNAGSPFLSKVDDDCLEPGNWAATLIEAHRQAPQLGMVGCWRFYDEDFVPELARKKIQRIAGHEVMLNCWVQGSGYVMKRAVVDQLGPLRPHESFTDYGIRAALAGWVNGWYFPFLHEEHMDDPRSSYNELRGDAEFCRNRPLSAINDNVASLDEWSKRVRWMARAVQEAPYNPAYYAPWRVRLRREVGRVKRALGWREPWRERIAL